MAGYNLQEISIQDFSRGIDQKSAPSNIPDGYSEDLVNVIVDSDGFAAKRPGYEGFYGYLPIRITSVQHSGTSIFFTLDSSINVANIIESPIVVYGKLSASQSGNFTTVAAGAYYTTFSSGTRSTLDPTSDTVVILESVHGVNTDDVALQVAAASNVGDQSNSWFIPDVLKISASNPYNVTVTGTQPVAVEFYTLIDDKSTVAGTSYVYEQTVQFQSDFADTDVNTGTNNINDSAHGFYTGDMVQFSTTGVLPGGISLMTNYFIIKVDTDNYKIATTRALAVAGTPVDITSAAGGGTHTATLFQAYITISAATHSLANFNIIPHVFYSDGTSYHRLPIVDVIVNSSTGLVNVTLTVSSGAAEPIRVVLFSADPADAELKTVAAQSTDTIVISTTEPFNFFALYNSVGAVNTLVTPDSVEYNDTLDHLVITITNSALTAESYKFFWEAAVLQSSVLQVTDTLGTSTSYTDTAPQLTLWGLPHSELYDTAGNQEGFVNHIDTYRTDSESRVMSALGGNLYGAYTRAEVSAAYKIPTAAVDIKGSVASDALIGPVFSTTGEAADRTNGNLVADDVVDNKALITAVAYISSGISEYTLTLTNKVGDLATAINITSATADRLTVTGMANSLNNGVFKITAVDNTTNTVRVENDLITSNIFDEMGAMARGGIFTDRITLTANSKFMSIDTFTSTLFEGFEPSVLTSSGTTVVLQDVTGIALMTAGTTLYPVRTTDVVPMASSMANFVRGDMCEVSGITRKVRVLAVNNSADINISSIVSTGSVATVTTASAHGLRPGNRAILLRTGVDEYNGLITITSVPNTSSFTFATEVSDTGSAGVVLGKTVQIDESLEVQDSASSPVTLTVTGRWIPIEAPTSVDNLPKATYLKHWDAFDYDKQQPLRSTMVKDNLYFTDSSNQVMKFDGSNVYQAGLFRWQPQLFAQIDTTTASLPLDGPVAPVHAVGGTGTENRFEMLSGASQFKAGDIVIHSQDSAMYTVQSIDAGNDFVYVTAATISGSGSGTLKPVIRYKYYFRLNAVDANKNIIASAATGKDDFVIDLTAAGQIHMRLVGLPVWGNYDYDSLELEVYRTIKRTDGPFYRIGVKDVSFSRGNGYIDFQDSVLDEFLTELDPVSTAVGLGVNLGTGWTQPLRAKHITSMNNRLVLGNIIDYPSFDITLRNNQSVGGVTAGNLSSKIFFFKKDGAVSGTTTDMVNRVKYQFVTSGATTIDPTMDIASTSTTFTIAESAHGLIVKDWVYLFHAAAGTDNELNFAGWFQIASLPDADHFTINFSGHGRGSGGGAAADVDRYIRATAAVNVPVWLGTDGSRNLVGANTINEFTSMLRLTEAINCTMRVTDVTLSGQTTFVPWMIAQAGNGIGIGRMIVRQEKPFADEAFTLTLPVAITDAAIFVDGNRQAASATLTAAEKVFQSRLLISYPEYPELFDNPYGDESSSTSVIDVNPADGQQVTGIVPFFSDSVFGQGTSEGSLAVFKTNSIYVVDLDNRKKTRVQSRGLGCTAPDSLALTKDGIIFANESGIFKLQKDLSVVPVGEKLERIFKDQVNREQLELMKGHHYGIKQQYKLSVPVGESTQTRNNQVLVYDYRREGTTAGYGAWTRFTNHNSTGWANLERDAFFATTDGQVFRIRTEDDLTDYRDDAAAVAEMEILLKANHFGAPGTRKIVRNMVSHFHMRYSSMTGTTVEMSRNLDGVFESAGGFDLTKDETNKVETARSSLPNRKMTYIQLKYLNSTKDESVILTGVDFHAALLNTKGIKESSE